MVCTARQAASRRDSVASSRPKGVRDTTPGQSASRSVCARLNESSTWASADFCSAVRLFHDIHCDVDSEHSPAQRISGLGRLDSLPIAHRQGEIGPGPRMIGSLKGAEYGAAPLSSKQDSTARCRRDLAISRAASAPRTLTGSVRTSPCIRRLPNTSLDGAGGVLVHGRSIRIQQPQ